ncbi:MAG: ornithine carbamoyltransferase [Vicinamibacterales bacterium]
MSLQERQKSKDLVHLRRVDRAKRSIAAKDVLSVLDLSHGELAGVLALASEMKQHRGNGEGANRPLAGRHVALLFEKPSLRTRSTFVIAVRELGGEVIEPLAEVALGSRETVEDVARSLERWVQGAVVRTFAQIRLEQFAAAAPRLHVVNALTDEEHPCQAIADMLTLKERFGELAGRTLAFVGDGNNVAASLAHAGAMLGVHVRVASPAGHELPARIADAARAAAIVNATVTVTNDPVEAVRGADAVYTDVWASMGQEDQTEARARVFQPYQVNDALMAAAGPDAIFMHCLPAHRGHEVTDSVIDSPASVVFEQAENRLHTQKALLALLMA